MISDDLKVTGVILAELYNEEGDLIEASRKNLVVTTGKNWVASRCAGASSNITHMAAGNVSTAAVVGNTALLGEIGRVAVDTAGGVVSNNTITVTATFPAGTATGAVSELGLLTAASAGTLVARSADGSVIQNKKATDVLKITWVLTIN